ncbi:asparaginase [Comamonas composti]|uniref:asparaginase n=1 Tax=Comamonas composti TaxID=408558 RepID=UPI00040FB5BA|nr:asparaginase [Comamonas composti]
MQESKTRLLILGTGGTIAGRAASRSQGVGYQAGEIGVEMLLDGLPELRSLARGELAMQQLAQVDSKDMSWSVWRGLLQACARALADPRIKGLVITHGTDTLEETAWLLQHVLAVHKPLVLTCAMRPATALLADGPQNLCDAVALAASGGRCGVWVVAASEVHAAQQVQKVHPYRLTALRSFEGGPHAVIEEGAVRWLVPAAESPPAQSLWPKDQAALDYLLSLDDLPWVEVLVSAALARPQALEALIQAGLRGLVLVGTGNATVHQALEPVLQRAREKGLRIRLATRCLEGLPVAQEQPGQAGAEGAELARQPWPQARIALMLELALEDFGRSTDSLHQPA